MQYCIQSAKCIEDVDYRTRNFQYVQAIVCKSLSEISLQIKQEVTFTANVLLVAVGMNNER